MQVDKIYQESKSCRKNSQNENSNNMNDSTTKFFSWILLTVCIGLCITASVIYIDLWISSQRQPIFLDKAFNRSFILNSNVEDSLDKYNGNSNFSFQLLGKLMDKSLVVHNMQGCYDTFCRIDCFNTENIYIETAAVMNESYCKVFSSLVLSDQLQHYLENKWITGNYTVKKITVIRSEFTKIKSEAFSSPIFAKVSHMTWTDLKLKEISNGALLGLYSLKKLEINLKVPHIRMTFLQPIQITLTHLKINCGLTFKSNSIIFENIYLEKLIHLDLSYNTFSGPLTKRIFYGTPNVTYLFLKYCQITAIESTAFQDIASTLILVNLKHNLLTQINAGVLGIGSNLLLIDVEPNNWNCNCQLRSLIKFYKENKNIFISAPYCRMPLSLYGTNFEEVNAEDLSCDPPLETKIISPENYSGNLLQNEYFDDVPTNESPYGAILQFSCLQAIAVETILENDRRKKRDVKVDSMQYSGKFIFEPPTYDLNLELLGNYTVRALIDGYQLADKLNIIWFTEEKNSYTIIVNSSQKDYNCMRYEKPYIITDPLHQNHTYTFCMMSVDDVTISPLFCQPLYVPVQRDNNNTAEINMAESEKQFTIAMLCLIFFISTIFGAIFAYLGIKSFPHLLEGSKNVMVIKNLDKTCCISTIAESQYVKTSFDKEHILESSLEIEAQRSSEICTETSSPLSGSMRSSSTCFEECITNIEAQTIEYEMPMSFTESSKLNKNLDAQSSPPPLPKRNSKVFN